MATRRTFSLYTSTATAVTMKAPGDLVICHFCVCLSMSNDTLTQVNGILSTVNQVAVSTDGVSEDVLVNVPASLFTTTGAGPQGNTMSGFCHRFVPAGGVIALKLVTGTGQASLSAVITCEFQV